MNRVTRISSAAFGMLLLTGLALYQGKGDAVNGEEGAMVGTALARPPEVRDVKCENPAGLSEQDQKYCAEKARSEKSNQH